MLLTGLGYLVAQAGVVDEVGLPDDHDGTDLGVEGHVDGPALGVGDRDRLPGRRGVGVDLSRLQQAGAAGLNTKVGGLHAAKDPDLASSFRTLIDSLKRYGIFVVPGGELESWLAHLGVAATANKKNWLLGVFDKLGGDPNEDGYVRPAAGDVWQFLREIAEWINDPHRQGV